MYSKSIFCYGTLRGDYSSNGDRWGVTNIKGVTWEYGKIRGFKLYQKKNLFYPFAIKTNDPNDILYGCILKCDSERTFNTLLTKCDSIEGYTGTAGGLYDRSLVTASSTKDKPFTCYIYYQKILPNKNIIYFKSGNWFKNRKEKSKIEKVLPNSDSCIVFSAPHNIKLIREGKEFHCNELYTDDIAKKFSKLSKGGFVTWNKNELKRCNEHGPDPKNDDPNYLKACNVEPSEWCDYFQSAITSANYPLLLHVDIHGMRGPNDKISLSDRADCIFGMVPMERNMGRKFTYQFKNLLEKNILPVLASYNMTAMIGGEKTTDYPALCGYWGNGRNTLTQLSSNPAFMKNKTGFTHAIQMELSMKLRKLLYSNHELCSNLLNAIIKSWQEHSLLIV